MIMRLSTMLKDTPGKNVWRTRVTGIAYDSRAVSPGYAFSDTGFQR